MPESIAPAPGIVAAPVDAATLNDGEGEVSLDTVAPPEPGTPSSIADASRAFRERLEKAGLDADASAEPASTEQPRNPDGTFAPKEPTDAAAVAPESTETPDPAAEVAEEPANPNDAPAGEPAVFVLKGEEQRGESDIELDITGLPPEVVERLERNAKQGMRRAEFDHEMRKVRADRANLDAVETEIAVDPQGFILNRIAPATKQTVAETLLLEQFEHLAPMIEVLWNDPAARYAKLESVKQQIESRRGEVVTSVHAARQAAEIRAAVSEMIPDGVSQDDADAFFATSIALLQQRAMSNQPVTSADVPTILAAHRRRFFGASDAAPTKAPSRPKLAVRPTPSPKAAQPAPPAAPTTVLAADEIARRAKARNAALATAPKGAGVGAVQRDVGPANETIEQRSRRLRAGG